MGASATGRQRRVAKMIKVVSLFQCVAFVYTLTLTHWHTNTHSRTHARTSNHPPTQAHTRPRALAHTRTHARSQGDSRGSLTRVYTHTLARTHAHHACTIHKHFDAASKTQSETSEISVSLPPRNAARS